MALKIKSEQCGKCEINNYSNITEIIGPSVTLLMKKLQAFFSVWNVFTPQLLATLIYLLVKFGWEDNV